MLGQHALSYTALGFLAIMIHRRLLGTRCFRRRCRCCRCSRVARRRTGDPHDRRRRFPGWTLLLAPLFEAAALAVASLLLLAPQRRTPEPDANRPLCTLTGPPS